MPPLGLKLGRRVVCSPAEFVDEVFLGQGDVAFIIAALFDRLLIDAVTPVGLLQTNQKKIRKIQLVLHFCFAEAQGTNGGLSNNFPTENLLKVKVGAGAFTNVPIRKIAPTSQLNGSNPQVGASGTFLMELLPDITFLYTGGETVESAVSVMIEQSMAVNAFLVLTSSASLRYTYEP